MRALLDEGQGSLNARLACLLRESYVDVDEHLISHVVLLASPYPFWAISSRTVVSSKTFVPPCSRSLSLSFSLSLSVSLFSTTDITSKD